MCTPFQGMVCPLILDATGWQQEDWMVRWKFPTRFIAVQRSRPTTRTIGPPSSQSSSSRATYFIAG